MAAREDKRDGVGQTDAEISKSLGKALSNTDVSVIYQNLSGHVVWSQNVPPAWGGKIAEGGTDEDFIPKAEVGRVHDIKKLVLSSGDPRTIQISVPDGQGTRWFNIWVDADKSDVGIVRGLLTTVVDTTEQRRREQTLRTLLREVSHRSKNLLSIIQSIATQTGRYSGSIDSFLTRFRGRILSLASSQDLVTSSNWRGANLHELVAGQVTRYCADPERNIRLSGENPYFNPNAALHIGLALHELAVNSISYGALSNPDGYVGILARRNADGDNTGDVELVWSETIKADSVPPKEKRFGSVALERVVPASLGGSSNLEITSSSLEYRLTVPTSNFEAD